MSINAIIESITCPITGDVMTDPVQGNDGQTYERSAIIQALNIKHESPITRQPMNVSDLKVNASIRFLCDKYHAGEFGNNNTIQAIAVAQPKTCDYNIKLDYKLTKTSDNKYLMLDFSILEESMPKDLEYGYLSQDIILVIDRSGSMRAAVEAKDGNGDKLENGMSIQDIVNHAAKTVAKTVAVALQLSSRRSFAGMMTRFINMFGKCFLISGKTLLLFLIGLLSLQFSLSISSLNLSRSLFPLAFFSTSDFRFSKSLFFSDKVNFLGDTFFVSFLATTRLTGLASWFEEVAEELLTFSSNASSFFARFTAMEVRTAARSAFSSSSSSSGITG